MFLCHKCPKGYQSAKVTQSKHLHFSSLWESHIVGVYLTYCLGFKPELWVRPAVQLPYFTYPLYASWHMRQYHSSRSSVYPICNFTDFLQCPGTTLLFGFSTLVVCGTLTTFVLYRRFSHDVFLWRHVSPTTCFSGDAFLWRHVSPATRMH